jgi:hypothetical protein
MGDIQGAAPNMRTARLRLFLETGCLESFPLHSPLLFHEPNSESTAMITLEGPDPSYTLNLPAQSQDRHGT